MLRLTETRMWLYDGADAHDLCINANEELNTEASRPHRLIQ
jgi:hypothetical protein